MDDFSLDVRQSIESYRWSKALETILRKAKLVIFVGGLAQGDSTNCQKHGTEDVDVLVLALHLCRSSSAPEPVKTMGSTFTEKPRPFFSIASLNALSSCQSKDVFSGGLTAHLQGAASRTSTRLFFVTCGGSEPIHGGLWGFARTVRLEERWRNSLHFAQSFD